MEGPPRYLDHVSGQSFEGVNRAPFQSWFTLDNFSPRLQGQLRLLGYQVAVHRIGGTRDGVEFLDWVLYIDSIQSRPPRREQWWHMREIGRWYNEGDRRFHPKKHEREILQLVMKHLGITSET